MASWKSCLASSNGMWCRQRLRCSLTVSALACAALLAADGASAQGEPQLEPCPGGGYNPTPTVVEVAAVPIVVESATTDYFVLYVSHEVDADTTVDIPVLVKRGEADTTTLAENVEALPKERYRVEQYLVSDPADVDGDCVDDITELGDPVSMNPVNPAAAIALRAGAVALPDRETFEKLSHLQRHLKFVLFGLDTDRPSVYFQNTKTHTSHDSFLDSVGLEWGQEGLRIGTIAYDPKLIAPNGSPGVYYYNLQQLFDPQYPFNPAKISYTLLAASVVSR